MAGTLSLSQLSNANDGTGGLTISTITNNGIDIKVNTNTAALSIANTGAITLSQVSSGVVISTSGAISSVVPGTSGNVLTSNGTTWTSAASGATITDDTSSNTTQYVGMSRSASGSWSTAYTASTKLYFNPSTGTLSATLFNTLSDVTVKENVVNITNAVDTISKLQGVEFTWKENGNKSSGVIAQDIEKVLPFLVDTNEEGVKSVNYSGLCGYFIETVKELSNRIAELEGK